MDLYFIALMPPPSLNKEIAELKKEMYRRTGAKKAFNAPAHITLQRPFRRDASFENKLASHLQLFAKDQRPFNLALSGFGCFEPRVVFVDVLPSIALQELHKDLQLLLTGSLEFEQKETNSSIHPHMTIATRDLSKSAFLKVWPTYKDRSFERDFTVKGMYLFKHDGKSWKVLDEFLFEECAKP